jgi:phosphatidylethanolamine-binding protein (PEBP) family uncharacterized protein
VKPTITGVEETGNDVRAAIDGHVLAEASVMGTYTPNPRLMAE